MSHAVTAEQAAQLDRVYGDQLRGAVEKPTPKPPRPMQPAVDNNSQSDAVRTAIELLHTPGDVFEIRALAVPSGRYTNTASGYFDNLDKAVEAAKQCDGKGAAGVYVTLNPVNPALLARANNRMVDRPKTTTQDSETTCRRWLFIDIDPHRPTGIAATEEEREAARNLAVEIEDALRMRGWSYPLLADSGNGMYLLYLIDLPNDEEARELLKRFYAGLETLLSDFDPSKPYAEIDKSVFNAARILRIGGTTNRKGDNTPDRPHRTCVYRAPIEECPVAVIPIELIREIADLAPKPETNRTNRRTTPQGGNGRASPHGDYPRLDVPAYLQARDVEHRTKDVAGGTAYLVKCPFDSNHGSNGETAVVQADSGLLTFACKHNSCQSYRWHDFRDAVGKPDREHWGGDGHHASAQTPSNAGKTGQADGIEGQTDEIPRPVSVSDLIRTFPRLRPPRIHGLLRDGETANIIAAPKAGKSFLSVGLALHTVTGQPWMGFDVAQGKVLILDNELHPETCAYRMHTVAKEMGLQNSDCDGVDVLPLRGRMFDIHAIGDLLTNIKPEPYSLVILDALYRFLPEGVDENSNGQMQHIYNQVDAYARRLDCAFVLIHHASKGNQSGKSITDVGSGAGTQSRAVDTHLVMRPHAEPDCVVLEAVCRSWPPPEPRVLCWKWPIWTVADDLDPADLKPERTTKSRQDKEREQIDECREAIEKALVTHTEHKDSKSQISARAGRKGKFFDSAFGELLREGRLRDAKITKANRQEYDGYEWVFRDQGRHSATSLGNLPSGVAE